MNIAVVGSGSAGLMAAHRLRQAGHRVTVLEALDVIGGRTHAEHFGPGHHCDTGAGWLASFYSRTLALLDELNCRDLLLPRNVRGAANLWIDGKVFRQPFAPDEIDKSPLLTDEDRQRWKAYIEKLIAEQPDLLEPDLTCDDHDAESEFAPLGHNLVEYVVRPLFEGPFFTRLTTLSAAMVRAWLRALQGATLYQVAGGMDAPWLKLANTLDVETNARVTSVRANTSGIELEIGNAVRQFDGAVLAIPAPAIAQIMTDAPIWIFDVHYAPQVRVYAARRNVDDADFGVHLIPPKQLFSVEYFTGRRGAWGACPSDWQWALACAYGPASGALLARSEADANRILWDESKSVAPDLFSLDQADVVHSIHWQWAVPILSTGHFRKLAAYKRRPPLVFAGDWTVQACVEGAVRSGEAAAAAFGNA